MVRRSVRICSGEQTFAQLRTGFTHEDQCRWCSKGRNSLWKNSVCVYGRVFPLESTCRYEPDRMGCMCPWPRKGADPENSQVLWCHAKQAFFSTFHAFGFLKNKKIIILTTLAVIFVSDSLWQSIVKTRHRAQFFSLFFLSFYDNISISMYIMLCYILCLFSALSRRVGALQISIIIIMLCFVLINSVLLNLLCVRIHWLHFLRVLHAV